MSSAKSNGNSYKNDPYIRFFLILAAGFLLRVLLSLFFTYENDFLAWRTWGRQITDVGFGRFYDEFWCDYMPGYLYILWGLDNLNTAFPRFSIDILFKLPANIADLGISLSIFYALRRITTVRNAMIASVVYLFNPASLSNSTFWGQVDSFHALPILLSVITALGGRFVLSGVFASLAFMIKPQSVVIFPLIGLIAVEPFFRDYRNKLTLKTFMPAIKLSIAIVITAIVVSLPFMWDKLDSVSYLFSGPIELIRARFSAAYEQYTVTSLNAFNFWGAVAMWQEDSQIYFGLSYRNWGTLIFTVSYAVIGILLLRVVNKSRGERDRDFSYFIYQAITLVLFSLFLFVTRAHERHLLPAIVFFTLITYRHWILWYLYAIVSVVYVLNMIYSYIQLTTSYQGVPEQYTALTVPGMFFLYLAAFLFLFYDFVKNTITYKAIPEHQAAGAP